MIELGRYQLLTIVKKTEHGVYLNAPDGPDADRVLLPAREVPQMPAGEGAEGAIRPAGIGDRLRVFIYKDSEDRPIATTAAVPLEIGGLAKLRVADTNAVGAFLDWGLMKDLFLPYKEQIGLVKKDEEVLVTLYTDKSSRLCASMHIYKALRQDSPYKTGDLVKGRIYEVIDAFGAYVAVDDLYSALIPKTEIMNELFPNQMISARVTRVLPDGRLNLSLRQETYLQMDTDAESVLRLLTDTGGELPYGDKSSAEEIRAEFQLSKNAFKRAAGRLMKQGKITIEDNCIKTVNSDDQ